MTRHLTNLWDNYAAAVRVYHARPDDGARLRLIAAYARFTESFDPPSAQENIQSLIWRLQQTKVAA
jgi:hypothetical protein